MNEKILGWSLALLVTALTACNTNVVGESGGSGTGGSGTAGSGTAGSDGGSTCSPQPPDLCSPSTACVGGQRQSGGAFCEDGEWVCTTTPCDDCSQTATTCNNGVMITECCLPGEDCNPPICDLGNGACIAGPCPPDGGVVDAG
jgi:hypothetical protein